MSIFVFFNPVLFNQYMAWTTVLLLLCVIEMSKTEKPEARGASMPDLR
jgi:hypothetical protein